MVVEGESFFGIQTSRSMLSPRITDRAGGKAAAACQAWASIQAVRREAC